MGARNSSIAFPHDKVDRAKNRDDVADHMARHHVRQHAESHERWSPNLQAIRRAAAAAANVEAQLALRIFRAEIYFSRRGVHPLRYKDEVVNQFLHLCEYLLLCGHHDLAPFDVDRAAWKFVEALVNNADA